MLTTVDIRGVKVTADQVGRFAIHPAVQVDQDSGEFFLCADTWVINHLPSGRDLMMLHEADPIEWPGNPLAIDMAKVRDFLNWLYQFADWSLPEPKPNFPETAVQAYRLFASSPLSWERPEAAA